MGLLHSVPNSKFWVLTRFSSFQSEKKKKKFPCSPSGVLSRATRKETPSGGAPIHLPHADTHARRHTAPRARLLPSGREPGPRAPQPERGRRGAGLRPGALGSSGAAGAAQAALDTNVGFHRLETGVGGGSMSHSPRNVAASPGQQNGKYARDV